MTIQTTHYDWQRSGLNWDKAPYESCAPNLIVLADFIQDRWGGQHLGCHGDRPIRAGSTISVHAYGRAFDWRYDKLSINAVAIGRVRALTEVIPWIIANSAELHIQQIHDYYGDRIWKAGRTKNVGEAHSLWWKKQDGAGSGMGESWATYFHFECHRTGDADTTPISERKGLLMPGQTAPNPTPGPVLSVPIPNTPPNIDRFAPADRVRWLQRVCNDLAAAIGLKVRLVEDGLFGAKTTEAVKLLQRWVGTPQDAVYGDATRISLATKLGVF